MRLRLYNAFIKGKYKAQIGAKYKVVDKLLASRLAKVVDNLVSGEQTAFVKGTQILDDPLMLDETIS